jgi:hypothetical protein
MKRSPVIASLFPTAALALAVAASSTGCERVPDQCEDYPLACLTVTVESGPPNVYQMRVRIDDAMEMHTLFTPRKQAKTPLKYPLRFGIRFQQFDALYRGNIDLVLSGVNTEYDVVGEVRTNVAIKQTEKQTLNIQLGEPRPDPVDFAELPDLASPADLATSSKDLPSQSDLPAFR